ncbi:unnamed protein product [Caenorhabditis brenneri]
MSKAFSKRWKTDPEYIDLLNYLINKTKDAKPPINTYEFIRDFKEKSGVVRTENGLQKRIRKMRDIIHSFEHIETDAKVRILFVLSVPVNGDFLQKLSSDAHVEVDEKNRITMYKSESLELKGYHSVSTPRNTKNYWATDREGIALLDYLIKKAENEKSPINLRGSIREFKETSGSAQTASSLFARIFKARKKIHSFEHLDKDTKVKLIYALSAPVDANFLKELKKNALVEVDDKKCITHYKSNDGSLELRGDHSTSAKISTAKQGWKRRSLLASYFEKKNDADTVPKNKREEEMWNFIGFITEKCDNIDSPLSIRQLVKDFNNHFGISKATDCIRRTIRRYSREIQTSKYLNTPTKVKQLFGLSATVDSDYLEKLRENALVEIDDKKRITHYKAKDGSIELRGSHSQSAKVKNAIFESKRNHRKLIIDYFENMNDSDAVPKTELQKEMENLIEFITEKCEQVNSPLSINQLAKDFEKRVGFSQSLDLTYGRIRSYCREIQKADFLDTHSKVKHLFSLSAKVTSDCLEKLREDAHVEVDEENRISYYKATDGCLELTGDHSKSAKNRAAKLESKRSHRWLIRNYFENMNDSDALPKTEEVKEMENLIKFITEKCENINSPIRINRLARDFNKHVGLSQSLDLIHGRIRGYCREIQRTEFLDTQTKVKQLFCLSMKLNSDCLKELRKTAVVEVDHENRIIKYTSNDGSLTLQGGHWGSKKRLSRCVENTDKDNVAAMSDNSEEESDHEGLDDSSPSEKNKSGWIVRRKSKKNLTKNSKSDGENSEESEIEDGYSEDGSDEYSSEEFGSEFDSDEENDSLDEPEDLTEPSNKTGDFDNETPVRNHSSSEMSIDDKFGFDPPIEKSHRSEEIEIREDKGNNPVNTENAVIKTRSGRLSKKRHLDSEFSYDLASFGSSRATMNNHSASSKPAKQKKIAIEKSQASFSSPNHSSLELHFDYDTNYSIDDEVKLEPFRGEIQEDLNGIGDDKDIQQIPKPMETPIKIEVEEPREVKPEASHNSEIKFFEAMHSLILCLDTPSLSEIQSKVHQKIQKIKGLSEVILNNEIVQIVDSLISRMTNDSVVNLSENVESVNVSNFLCYLKAAILNSKMIGVESLVQNISKLIEDSQNKRIPMKKVTNALLATLNANAF